MFRRCALHFRAVLVFLGLYWLLLFTVTHLPGSAAMAPPYVWDKGAHFLAYAGLAFLLASAIRAANSEGRIKRSPLWTVLPVAAAYAALDELIQVPIPGRYGDLRDWIADMLGAAAGLAAHLALSRVFRAPKSEALPGVFPAETPENAAA
jgi:VanZ family protein